MMVYVPVLVALLTAVPPIVLNDLSADPALLPEATVGALIGSQQWAEADPTWQQTSGHSIAVWRFGRRRVVRISPEVDGIAVEGADRILTLVGARIVRWSAGAPLTRSGTFSLTYDDAMLAAADAVPAGLIRDPKSQPTRGLAVRRWLRTGHVIRATWRVRVPTFNLRDLRDVWIDAENGSLLLSQPVVKFQAAPTPARVFTPAPDPAGVDVGDLVDVTLEDLLPGNVGDYLRGYHMETYNCCKKYSCTAGNPPCDEVDRICEPDSATGPQVADSTILIGLPADMLPAMLQGSFPDGIVWLNTVFCSELPNVTSRAAAGSDPAGWFETPVDTERTVDMALGLATETDAFAELQTYYTTWTFFNHIRTVLEDPTFCLTQESMRCDGNGDSILDAGTGLPVLPFHIATNFLLPELDMTDLGTQILFQGLGTDQTTPVVIDDYMRNGNAAFIPALSDGPIQIPPELAPLAAQFNRDYDSNLYFQGSRDFAYDGDVVAHEFTHGIVHTYVPGLRSGGRDAWGSHVEPGAMNEGWSDYFAASWTNSSATGEYSSPGESGETGLRDADNSAACPTTLIGEVHEDSLPWSGALWEARRTVETNLQAAGVASFDQLLLSTLAASADDENMEAQAQRILAAIEADSTFDAGIKAAAEDAFNTRKIIGCERIWSLNDISSGSSVANPKAILMQPAPGDVGTQNLAPPVMQFKVELPPATLSARVAWNQSSGGFGGMGDGTEITVLRVLANETSPIKWKYEGNLADQAVPYDVDDNQLTFDVNDAGNQAIVGTPNSSGIVQAHFEWQVTADPCNARTFYVAVASVDNSVTMNDITVTVQPALVTCAIPGDPDGDPDGGCNCGAGSGGLAALAGLLFLVRRRRR